MYLGKIHKIPSLRWGLKYLEKVMCNLHNTDTQRLYNLPINKHTIVCYNKGAKKTKKEVTTMERKEKVVYVGKVIVIVTIIIIMLITAYVTTLVDGKEAVKTQTNKRTDNYYALTTLVVKVDRENDTVTCLDSVGNTWQFYGTEDWQEGDCASLLMWDNGTESITDDEIHSARYNAWGLTR